MAHENFLEEASGREIPDRTGEGVELPRNLISLIESKDEEKINETIQNLTDEELEGLMSVLPQVPQRHQLSQESVDLLVERNLQTLERSSEGGKIDFDMVVKITQGLMINTDLTRLNPNDESIGDKAFRANLKLYEKYPNGAGAIENIFGQNHFVRPDILIDETAQAVGRYGASKFLRQDLMSSLQYLHAFSGGAYDSAIERNLDFKNPDNYSKTANFIEFLKRLYFISADTSFSEKEAPRLRQLLNEAVEKQQGSYLLNVRAKEVYSAMENGDWGSDQDHLPVLITGDRYAFHLDDVLYISEPSDRKKLEDLVGRISELSEDIDKILRKSGQISMGYPLMQERSSLYSEIYSTMRVARVEDLAVFGEANEEDLASYAYLLRKPTRERVEKDFGIKISEMSLSEQFQFLNFIKTKEAKHIPPVQNFVSRYGKTGFRTFLSLEYGREFGDSIVELGEKLPQDQAERIFIKYSELVDAAESAGSYVREHYGKDANEATISSIQDNLMRRGRDLLSGFATRLNSAGAETVTAEELEKELELTRADASLFAASFREFSQNGETPDFSEIKGVSFESEVSGGELSPADVDRMKELYKINYILYPKFQKMLIERFDSVVRDPANRFYILRYEGVIEGFYRLGITESDTTYFGAFNMNPRYRGSGIGEALMQKSLDVVAKDSVIEASCTATEAIASNYVERGFVGTGAEQVHEIYSMDIVRNDQSVGLFSSKSMTAEEIKQKKESGTLPFECVELRLSELTPEAFSPLNQKEGGKRNVLTRYIRDKKADTVLLVFEKIDEANLQTFSRPTQMSRLAE